MQARQGCVRGLDLHLERLDRDALGLFGVAPGPDRVREAVLHALPGADSSSVRVTVFSRDLRAVVTGEPVEPDVMVTVTDPTDPAPSPLRVSCVPYEREMPQAKHLATYGLLRGVRTARTRGFDDAMFVDRANHLSEGSTWNLCLHDGEQWVWPEAEALDGITMQLLKRAMQDEAIPVVTTPVLAPAAADFRCGFATNSVSAARPVSAIDETVFSPAPGPLSQLRDLYDSVPWQPI
jgi:branched-subunit amino acid aminotransferase/4-amino-4-deoxychorismate lyase